MKKTYKSYKLSDDSLAVAAEMFQLASSALYRRKEEFEEARTAYNEALTYHKDQEAKLIELLKRNKTSIIYNRVKYSVVNDKLVKELILE